jgi:hypothetical protein
MVQLESLGISIRNSIFCAYPNVRGMSKQAEKPSVALCDVLKQGIKNPKMQLLFK